MERFPRRLVLTLGGVSVGAVLLAGCTHATPTAVPPRVVATHVVAAGAGYSETNYSGEVKARHETPLAFRVGGKLVSRPVEVGESVAPGQLLARIDPVDLELNDRSARANLSAAESELAYARADYERYRSLRASNTVTTAELEAKEAVYKAARGKVDATRAQANLARNQSAYASLVADEAGVVSAVLVEAGQVVAAGQPVLRLAEPGEKEVAITVPERRVDELTSADVLSVSLWAHPEHQYRGRIREVAPVADPVTRTYAVRVAIVDADAKVRLGMTANVLLRHADEEHLALIPATAIFQEGAQPAVWVIAADGTVTLRPVDVAAFREDGTAIRGGLQPGERIVTAGAHKLTAGETVRFSP